MITKKLLAFYNNIEMGVQFPLLYDRKRKLYSFKGVHPGIVLYLSKTDSSVWFLNEKGDPIEWLADFDILTSYSNEQKKYFDELTLPEYREYYNTAYELWQSGWAIPLCEWCQQKFRPNNVLVGHLHEEGSMHSVEIVDVAKVPDSKQEKFLIIGNVLLN